MGTIVKRANDLEHKLQRERQEGIGIVQDWLSMKGRSTKKEACSRTCYSNVRRKEWRRKRLVG